MNIEYNTEKDDITVELNTPSIELDTPTGGRGLKGDTGSQGPKGDKGDTGNAATVVVGSTTTGDAGTSASVSNSGTAYAAVLDFTIPKGDKGDTGAAGQDGQDGQDGADGVSPIITTSKSGKTTTITIVDADGTKTATILDGEDGASTWGNITGTLSEQTDLKNALDDKADVSSLSSVATSGSYNDLSNTPTIPDELADLQDDTTHRVVTDTEKSTWSGKQDSLVSGTNIKTINNTSILGSGDIEVATDIGMYATTQNSTFYKADKKGIYWYTGATAFNLGVGASDISFGGKKVLMFMQKIDASDVPNLQTNDIIGYALSLRSLENNNGKIQILSDYDQIKYDPTTPSKMKLANGNGTYIDNLASITHISNNYYNKSEVDSLIATVSSLNIEVVQTLPTQDISTSTIYLVPNSSQGTNNYYDEYIYVSNAWELIGSTQVDLSDYYTKTETNTLLGNKQDTLVSGTNIKTINNESLLGSGNITIQGGGGTATDVRINGTSITSNDVADIQTEGTYNSSTNKIATMSDIPTVPTVGNAKTYYGTSSTSASTAAKTVTCSGFTLETGATIFVKFTNANSYNGTATLNVNSTGARTICSVGTTETTRYYWKSGEVVGFVYDGTNYVMIEKAPATTTYYGITKLSSSTSSTSEALSATPKAVKAAYDLANGKQDALVSGTNIKTINSTSLLGSGDISVSTFSGSYNDLTDKPTIPDELSDLSDDSTHRLVTDTEKSTWNSKSDFSGSYNDLTNKPTIPTVPTNLSSFTDDLGNSPTHTHSQYLTSFTETDPVFTASAAHGISSNDITNWNGKLSCTEITTSNVSIYTLDAGVYKVGSTTYFSYYGSTYDNRHKFQLETNSILVVNGTSDKDFVAISPQYGIRSGTNTSSAGNLYHGLKDTDIANNLTTITTGKVLDASQGAALKDQVDANSSTCISNSNKIGTLSNLNTTTQTDLVSAINEVNDKNNYTSTEQEVGTWLNKKMYRIVITSTTKNFTGTTHTIGTLNDNYKMVMVDILFHNTTDNNEYLVGNNVSSFYHDGGNLKVQLTGAWGTGYMEAVVYYTKD